MPYEKYSSVIFNRGSELEDPKWILEGKGKSMRYIIVSNTTEVADENIGYYIKQSFLLKQGV